MLKRNFQPLTPTCIEYAHTKIQTKRSDHLHKKCAISGLRKKCFRQHNKKNVSFVFQKESHWKRKQIFSEGNSYLLE